MCDGATIATPPGWVMRGVPMMCFGGVVTLVCGRLRSSFVIVNGEERGLSGTPCPQNATGYCLPKDGIFSCKGHLLRSDLYVGYGSFRCNYASG
eukprot:SAG11_NODE_4167_length_2029_cov_0.897927_1_plen_93_part_10